MIIKIPNTINYTPSPLSVTGPPYVRGASRLADTGPGARLQLFSMSPTPWSDSLVR